MKIKMLVMDVDGTLTDGKIYFGADGEMFKAFNVKDGYAIAHILPQYGIIPVIITGRSSTIVAQRAKDLKINELYQGISDKLTKLKEVADQKAISLDEIAYIGDDVNDLECIESCGFSGCPSDALAPVLSKVDYICKNIGGNGAVREFIDYITERIDK